jgi:cytochrome c oxidase cbb3-type subunit 3
VFSKILQEISGIGIYPMISLIVFVLFFSAVLFYVVRMKKDDADKMSQLPLN